MLRALGLASLVLGLGCQSQQPLHGDPLFEVGADNDPVMQMALSNATYNTLQITVTNNTSYDFVEGLIANVALFTVGQTASTAFMSYVQSGSPDTGNPIVLANKLGLVMGASAFYVPAVPHGQTRTFVVHVPPPMTGKLSMVQRVDGTVDDYVGFEYTSVSTLATNLVLSGYDPNDNKGKVALGNGTTGSKVNAADSELDLTTCTATMTAPVTLLNTAFTAGAWNHIWPWNIGFDGDFNGDWYTDGTTARMIDVNAKLPTITGFAKFFYVCPAAGATISAFSDIATLYKQAQSDTTMVVYFFDANNQIISHAENLPLHGHNYRKHALYDAVIPAGTRKIAVVPMGYFALGETDSSHYYNLTVQYEPATTFTTATLASDDFSSYDATTKNATGWSEYGSDWFVHPTYNHATVWNPNWQSPKPAIVPPMDTGMTKTFPLGAVTASTKLSARLFAASTFTDESSFVQLRLKFDTGQEVTASQLATSAWADLDIRRTPIPTGATSVTVTIQTYLGPTEQSSVYVDNLTLSKVQ